jgi:Secretion system C-terminal sorting domain
MKKIVFFLLVAFSSIGNAQSVIQTVNSGSVISTIGSVSVGEIVIVPVNTAQSNSGIIGILAQVNAQTLEVSQFELSEHITVFPNPTVAKLFFSSKNSLVNKKVNIYNEVGQLVAEKQIDAENALYLEDLSTGIYMIQFSDKNLKMFKIIKK